jgi:hypothetical protein
LTTVQHRVVRTYRDLADFERAFDRAAAEVATAAKRSLTPADRQALRQAISDACIKYNRSQYWAGEISRRTLHEIGTPLAKVVEILKRDENRHDLLVALGAPDRRPGVASSMVWPEGDLPEVERAAARYESTLRALDEIAHAVPSTPKRPAHRPSGTRELRSAVEILVDYWERTTRQRFTQDWHRGSRLKDGGDGHGPKPSSAGARFIYNAMNLIDVQSVGKLPGVTKAIVAARRCDPKSKPSNPKAASAGNRRFR